MKRGGTERETCDLNGWVVGTRLIGDEGNGPATIRITAIGERELLAICETHHTAGELRTCGRESTWTLHYREWAEADPSP